MRFLTGTVLTLLLGVGAVTGGVMFWGRDLPPVDSLGALEFGGKTQVFDRSGQFVGTLSPKLGGGDRANRTLLKASEFSPWLKAAVVTSEDRRFYKHHGLDFQGLARALWSTLRGDLEGGSTLTQQLVKNTILADLNQARTAERKVREAILAFQVERNFSKEEILSAYLNVIYWGAGGARGDIVGAQTAARAYFGKDASRLGLAESTYLATLIPSPRRYFNYAGYRPLMRDLLNRMVEDGMVTKAQADAAWRVPLQPAGWRVRYDGQGNVVSATLVDKDAKIRNMPKLEEGKYTAFLDVVQDDLVKRFGSKTVYSRGGLKVYTTMDVQAQNAANVASQEANVPSGATLGLALVQPSSGEVLALVGQKLGPGRESEWNNAVDARRQVGSSVKPLLYTLALEKGWKQSDTVLDAPISGDYQPQNYSGTYLGRPVTLRYSLDHSLNLPTVRLAQQIGVRALENKVRALGLTPPPDAGLSLSIGTLEASPLQMALAYATFANGGTYHEPTFVKRVVNADGKELALPKAASRRVWSPQVAYLGLDMLSGVVNDLGARSGGLAWRARIPGWQVGGKTGTTNDVKDLWFAGVTPSVAGAVWVGRQAGGAMPLNSYSGEIAAPIWQTAVAGTLRGRPVVAFEKPSDVTFNWVRGVNMAFVQEAAARGGVVQGLRDFFGGRSNPNRTSSPTPKPQASQQQATREQEQRRQAQQAAQQEEARRQAEQQAAARQQAEQQAAQEAARQQELQRQTEEQAAQEAARQQELQRQAEQQAAQEAARQQELQRQAEEQAAQEAARQQELQRQAEEQAAQEAARQQELQRQAEEQAAQEAARQQELQRQAEEQERQQQELQDQSSQDGLPDLPDVTPTPDTQDPTVVPVPDDVQPLPPSDEAPDGDVSQEPRGEDFPEPNGTIEDSPLGESEPYVQSPDAPPAP
ncbi:transglycosylase domain-containing protein [Deinococcus yavapaiensis]|uniref:peptidoglycan glycosyltransferase n=1 Tax=Deinococcus yavapaiensis KR-236 TaxID=694435 RepID=A0A318S672_9DEIO|nr:transglycosylase domain-containing protein [Deinococcus yavapaiensis]PYE53652.1 membrane peptidoglycan carboxypeptidase [Deinococcus yavapaiensis KR-236]